MFDFVAILNLSFVKPALFSLVYDYYASVRMVASQLNHEFILLLKHPLTHSVFFSCCTQCLPENIGPKPEERGPRIGPRGGIRHACEACNYGQIQPCPTFHHNYHHAYQLPAASHPHESTGSTVSTFLTQRNEPNPNLNALNAELNLDDD